MVTRHRVSGAVTALAATWVLAACTGGGAAAPVVSASGPVPAPSGGAVSQTVAPAPQPSPVKTDLTARATPSPGVEIWLSTVESIETKAQAPGETSGPGVAITVTVANSSGKDVDPSGLEIAIADAKGRPGSGMTGAPADWLNARIPSGSEKSGVYVFALRGATRGPVTISVALAPGLPRVEFKGQI